MCYVKYDDVTILTLLTCRHKNNENTYGWFCWFYTHVCVTLMGKANTSEVCYYRKCVAFQIHNVLLTTLNIKFQ